MSKNCLTFFCVTQKKAFSFSSGDDENSWSRLSKTTSQHLKVELQSAKLVHFSVKQSGDVYLGKSLTGLSRKRPKEVLTSQRRQNEAALPKLSAAAATKTRSLSSSAAQKLSSNEATIIHDELKDASAQYRVNKRTKFYLPSQSKWGQNFSFMCSRLRRGIEQAERGRRLQYKWE